MAYSKQTWADGESVANAARLNHMEDGIGAAQVATTAIVGEIGVVDVNYAPGDCRRYGITPDGVTDWSTDQGTLVTNWLDSIAATGVTGFAPTGFYNTELNINISDVRIRFEEGAEWAGIIHVEPATPETDPVLTGVQLFGTAVTYDRFGTAATSGCYVERIHCKSDGTKNVSNPGVKGRGCHIYIRTEDFTCEQIVVEDFDQAGANNDAAVAIDGFGFNPVRVTVGRILVERSDLHGVYITGEGHRVGDIIVNEYGSGAYSGAGLQDANGLAQSQELKGVWVNRAWDSRIDRINISQGAGTRTNAVYDVMLDESGLSGAAGTVEVGEINCSNITGSSRGVSFSDLTYPPNVLSVWKVGTIRATTTTGRSPIAGYGAVSVQSPAEVAVDLIRFEDVDTFDALVVATGARLSGRSIDAGEFKNRLVYAQGYVNLREVRGTRTSAGSSSPGVELAGTGAADSVIDLISVPAATPMAVRALLLSCPRPRIGKLYAANYQTSGGAICTVSGCTAPAIGEFNIEGPGSAGTGLSLNSTTDIMLNHGTVTGFSKGMASTGTVTGTAVGVTVSGNTTNTDIPAATFAELGCVGLQL